MSLFSYNIDRVYPKLSRTDRTLYNITTPIDGEGRQQSANISSTAYIYIYMFAYVCTNVHSSDGRDKGRCDGQRVNDMTVGTYNPIINDSRLKTSDQEASVWAAESGRCRVKGSRVDDVVGGGA